MIQGVTRRQAALPGQAQAPRGPAALAAAAGMSCAEVLVLGGYLLSGVFLDEVRGAGQQNRSVIRECLLESSARAVPEGESFKPQTIRADLSAIVGSPASTSRA
jgi:hypothetical protein